MASFRELLKETKSQIREVDTAGAAEAIARNPGTVVLDVREPEEYEQGALPGAVHLPRGHLESKVESQVPDRSMPIVIHCASWVRSAFAAKTLQDLGYTDVVSMSGGFNKWKDEGREWVTPRTLSAEQRNRYQRHLLLPEVGEKGQQKLLDSRMLLLGAGGLGSPAALYLAAAGVGTLGIIDMDVVDGSIFRFEGQATVFAPYVGPCYRCMIPEPPPAELAPSCAEAGVLGVLPGIIGSIQAMEAIKVLLQLGDPLIGRLLAYDALEESFRVFKVNRDPECPACGENAGDIVIAEYDELCMPHPREAPPTASA